MHFEDLWEQAEKEINNEDELSDLIRRILLKINAFQALDGKKTNSPEEISKIEEHLMGEILLDFAHISAIKNINVFKSLQMALHFKKIENLSKINQDS